MNLGNECVYHVFSGSKCIFLVLYVSAILLVLNDMNFLTKCKKITSKNFVMKDLGDASCVLDIQIYVGHSQNILGLSQTGYV